MVLDDEKKYVETGATMQEWACFLEEQEPLRPSNMATRIGDIIEDGRRVEEQGLFHGAIVKLVRALDPHYRITKGKKWNDFDTEAAIT